MFNFSHPDSNRRLWNLTRSTAWAKPLGAKLYGSRAWQRSYWEATLPPVGNYTPPRSWIQFVKLLHCGRFCNGGIGNRALNFEKFLRDYDDFEHYAVLCEEFGTSPGNLRPMSGAGYLVADDEL